MPPPRKPASPTSDQKIAALEKAFLKQAAEHDALKETVLRQSLELARSQRNDYGWFANFDDAVAEMEARFLKCVAEQQSFDRFGKLRGEFMAKEDAVYRELKQMRGKFEALEESVDKATDLLVILIDIVRRAEQHMAQVDEAWPVVESTASRADKAVQDLQSMLGSPVGPEPRQPLASAVDILVHQVRSGQARLAVLERQFGDLLVLVSTSKALPAPAGEPPVVAAPAGRPDSAFPADGLVKVSMGEIGGKPCPVVDGRELHAFIGSKDAFAHWIKDQIGRARLKENKHFEVYGKNPKNSQKGGRPRIDYLLTLDGAMHVAMAANTDKAFEVRDYFIECEERLRDILGNPAGRAGGVGQTMAEAPKPATTVDDALLAQRFNGVDRLFMACIVLAEGTRVREETFCGRRVLPHRLPPEQRRADAPRQDIGLSAAQRAAPGQGLAVHAIRSGGRGRRRALLPQGGAGQP